MIISRLSEPTSPMCVPVSQLPVRVLVRVLPCSSFHSLTWVLSYDAALVQLFTLSPKGGAIDLTKFAKPLGATIVMFGLLILVFGTQYAVYTSSPLTKPSFSSSQLYRRHPILCNTVRTCPRPFSRGKEFHHGHCFLPRVAGWHSLWHHCRRHTRLIAHASVVDYAVRDERWLVGDDLKETGSALC